MRIHRLLLVALAVAALPAAASASTITQEGSTLVMRGAPGETNVFHVAPDEDSPGRLLLSDTSQPTSYPSDCAVPWDYFAFVSCPMPSAASGSKAATATTSSTSTTTCRAALP